MGSADAESRQLSPVTKDTSTGERFHERALTSIALVSAIMAVNPGPFVVLDEVDAALDEANTFRFAAILEELAKLTQFIVITHNRATMEKADVLYGVTMGDDGISNLLSVNLSDITDKATARR